MAQPATQVDSPLYLVRSDREAFNIRTAAVEALEDHFKHGGVGKQNDGGWCASAVRSASDTYVITVTKCK